MLESAKIFSGTATKYLSEQIAAASGERLAQRCALGSMVRWACAHTAIAISNRATTKRWFRLPFGSHLLPEQLC